MPSKQHATSIDSDASTTEIVLIVLFIFVAIILAAYFIANLFINRSMGLHERTMHHDFEACHLLVGEQNQVDYNTFTSGSHETFNRNPASMLRREQIREQIRDHISAVYLISVSRTDADLLSSDDSDSDSDSETGEIVQEQLQEERDGEERVDSSESEER